MSEDYGGAHEEIRDLRDRLERSRSNARLAWTAAWLAGPAVALFMATDEVSTLWDGLIVAVFGLAIFALGVLPAAAFLHGIVWPLVHERFTELRERRQRRKRWREMDRKPA